MKDLFNISGKVIVITGGCSGIGSATAELFASKKANVALVDILDSDSQETIQLKNRLNEYGIKCEYYKCSVVSENDVIAVTKKIIEDFSKIDILFNNAGAAQLTFLEDMTEEQWDITVDVSMKGAFLCTREFGKFMISQQEGAIINMASIAGLIGLPRGTAHHSAAKAGVMGFTRAAAVEWAKHNIRVNAIVPGQIKTKALQKVLEKDNRFEKEILKEILLGRIGKTEEIAHCVLFLASDAAGFITGQSLVVDGGTIIK